MVLFFTVLLALSLAGMLTLLGTKHYELATGRVIFAGVRPSFSQWMSRAVFLFGTALPTYLRWQFSRACAAVSAWIQKITARGVVAVEHWLERVLHTVRKKTEAPRAPGEASAFLREVGEYKKKLSKRSEGEE